MSDYADLGEFKDYGRVTSTDAADDGVIGVIIGMASRYIESVTGRRFYARVETRYYDVPEDRELWLDEDLLSVTTLINGDGTVIASTEYHLVPKNTSPHYMVRLIDTSGIYWTWGAGGSTENVISVAGRWGYSEINEPPQDIKVACLMIASAVYHRRFGENASGASLVTPLGGMITPQDVPSLARDIIQRYERRV